MGYYVIFADAPSDRQYLINYKPTFDDHHELL